MKNIFLITVSLILFSLSANGQTKDNYTIKVDGLGCPFCAYGLEKKFKEFKDIDDVNIEMETGVFTFSYPSDQPLSIEKVESQVGAAGYTAVSTEIVRADGAIEKNEIPLEEEVSGEATEYEFMVAGNCGMCEARIEKAANAMKGVSGATWDKKTKMLNIQVVGDTSLDDVKKAIAVAGHDTDKTSANDGVYENLPGCCHYDRVEN